jgi:hypothetical protein
MSKLRVHSFSNRPVLSREGEEQLANDQDCTLKARYNGGESINPIRQRCDMTKTISRDELREKIDRGDSFMLLETLAPMAYQHAHLPGAINMPPDQVTQLAAKLLSDKQADIVVYCASPT